MRNFLGTVLPLLCLLNAAHARADEMAAKSRIVAVGLFKNGLAVIKREVTLGKAGTYVLDDVPEPVHGTYWIESVAPVESSVEMREVEVPVNELAPVKSTFIARAPAQCFDSRLRRNQGSRGLSAP